jgi:hypothetical protein
MSDDKPKIINAVLQYGIFTTYMKVNADMRTIAVPMMEPVAYDSGGFGMLDTNGPDILIFEFEGLISYDTAIYRYTKKKI